MEMERDYHLDKEQRQETLWFIRQYDSLKMEYNACIKIKGGITTVYTGGRVADPVFYSVDKSLRLGKKIDAIEKGISHVPEEYRKGIMDHIIKRTPFPYFADPTTWKRWQRRFVWFVYWEREMTNC